jgi:hypothetical protein
MIRRHLTDAQLIEASMGRAAVAGLPRQDPDHIELHIHGCAECRARHDALRGLLAETSSAAQADADAAFPPDRLSRQHTRIMEGVELLTQAGRVISFPSAFGRVTPPSAASGSRWVAAAAAAGLVVGLLGGHLTHDLRVQPSATLAGRAPASAARAVVAPASQPGEEELLGQVEVAFEGRGPSALRPLDALTPVAWDVRE